MVFRRWTSTGTPTPATSLHYSAPPPSPGPTLRALTPASVPSLSSLAPPAWPASSTSPAPLLSKAADSASQCHSCESPLPSNDRPSPPSFANPVRALTLAEARVKLREEEYYVSHALSTPPPSPQQSNPPSQPSTPPSCTPPQSQPSIPSSPPTSR
ncbi:uncharacterized protein K441DRAFT_52613 [Cenococcum geophilum 1.58]|uniref:uncharacterized protein n=1 Tax=Cenococcum geophilum 1.58 TaxID=794803 RepID=UPI0035900F74|nr:hypothetical protein K441DRAFT_52613 [Cenococcum geophilum 1.58]